MTACLVLLPLAGVIAILTGKDPRVTARLTTALMLMAGILLAVLWSMGIRDGLSMDPVVLSKPEIRLGMGLYDGMSVIMMLLSVTVAFAAARTGSCADRHAGLWNISLLLVAAGAIGAFVSTDLFFFYAFHELALVPTFLMIGILGRGERKIIAWKATIYLAFGSIVLLAGLLWLVSASGTSSLAFDDLLASSIPSADQRGIALLLIVGFGTLVSLFPFHSWAAPTYASAPAPIAMLHAGVLKKFGLYGLLRIHPLVPEGMNHWLNLLIVLLVGGLGMLFSMFLGVADIVGTQVLLIPVPGPRELTESTMVLIVFGALAYAQIRRAHIRVELLYLKMPPRGRAVMDVITDLAAIAFFGLILSEAISEAQYSYQIKEATTGLIRFPLWPARFTLVTGCSLMILQLCLHLIEDLIRIRTGDDIESETAIIMQKAE